MKQLLSVSITLVILAFLTLSATAAEPRDGDVELSTAASFRPFNFPSKPEASREPADGDVEVGRSTEPAQIQPPKAPPVAQAPVPEARIESPVRLPALIHLSDSTYDAVLGNYRGLVLIDFYSKSCGPCIKTGPIVERWAEEFRGQVQVVKIECATAPRLVERFHVDSLPCLVLMNGGREITREVGEPPPDILRSWIQRAR